MVRVLNGETDITDKDEWKRFLIYAESRLDERLKKEAEGSL